MKTPQEWLLSRPEMVLCIGTDQIQEIQTDARAHLIAALKEALWLLKDPPIPFPYKDAENSEWYDRRSNWLDATINKALEGQL